MFEERSGDVVNVEMSSVVKLLGGKKNEMKDRVKKVVRGSVLLMGGGMYERMMREDYDESFVVKGRKWGVRRGDSCIIENRGNEYVELVWENVLSSVYYLDGEVIEKEEIEGLKESVYREDGVNVRCVKIENIRMI